MVGSLRREELQLKFFECIEIERELLYPNEEISHKSPNGYRMRFLRGPPKEITCFPYRTLVMYIMNVYTFFCSYSYVLQRTGHRDKFLFLLVIRHGTI